MLGVRYYMAVTPSAQGQADMNPDLHLVASSGPWTVHYPTGDQQRTWKIYEAGQSDLVAPLSQPARRDDQRPEGRQELAGGGGVVVREPRSLDVPLAVSGPKEWQRVKAPLDPLGKPGGDLFGGANVDTPTVPIADPPTVSNIVQKDDRISFDVSEVGKPVLVKESYFPNWKASGAKGPYRVTPNQMVVIPTSTHVTLHYGYTPRRRPRLSVHHPRPRRRDRAVAHGPGRVSRAQAPSPALAARPHGRVARPRWR